MQQSAVSNPYKTASACGRHPKASDRRRRLVATGLVVLLGLLPAACSSGEPAETPSAAATADATLPTAAPTATPTESEPSPNPTSAETAAPA